jgi:hypothetical protein
MDRKSGTRGRPTALRAVSSAKDAGPKVDGPTQEIVAVGLGYRMVYSEQAEIWTLTGFLRDGTSARQDIGELSFTLIPGDMEPATAVVGFICPSAPYKLSMHDDALWAQLRGLVTQLGYDQDGFYVSIAVGGEHRYYEDYKR